METQLKKELVRRLSIAEGHLKKVKTMLEEDAYCLDIIHQSRAVQASLKKVDEKVLEGHLHSCVLGKYGQKEYNQKEVVDEVVELFKKG